MNVIQFIFFESLLKGKTNIYSYKLSGHWKVNKQRGLVALWGRAIVLIKFMREVTTCQVFEDKESFDVRLSLPSINF